MKISKPFSLVSLFVLLAVLVPGTVFLQAPEKAPTATQQASSNGSAPAVEPPATPAKSVRFAVIGDTGTGDTMQFEVAKQMVAEYDRSPYKFVIHVGDIIYGKGFSKIGEVFDVPYKPLFERGVNFHATLGNHDQDNPRELSGYALLGMGGRTYYSFAPEAELVEFFTFDSTVVLKGRGADQLEWLDKAMGESKARWKIVFFHHPPYSSGKRHGDDDRIIDMVVPILKKHKVQIVLNGHEHFFARLKPIEGINYIISGSGGKIHKGGLRYDGRVIYGNDQIHQFMSVTLTRDVFDYSVIGADGKVVFREQIRYEEKE